MINSRSPKEADLSPSMNLEEDENLNNNNRRSIKFINVVSSDSMSYKRKNCLLIDSKYPEEIFMSDNNEPNDKPVKIVNEVQLRKERKINKLHKGQPTVRTNFDCNTFSTNNTEQSDTEFPFEYFFYSYFYPSEVDDGLMPFVEHFENEGRSSDGDDQFHVDDNMTDNRADRRLRSIEVKCKVRIRIGNLLTRFIKGLPRRKVTLTAKTPEHVARALSCMEGTMPEIFGNAIFPNLLDCRTLQWPNSSGFLLRRMRKSMHFHKRCLKCPITGGIWSKSIDPKRVFPFRESHQKFKEADNQSNECNTIIYLNNADMNDATEPTSKCVSNSVHKQEVVPNNKNNNNQSNDSYFSNKNQERKNENNNCGSFYEDNDLLKYLKFPNCEESSFLFQCNPRGEPVNNKFTEYLKLCKCHVENIRCRNNRFGIMYYIVKIRYQHPSQLVKLFLLIKFKIKY